VIHRHRHEPAGRLVEHLHDAVRGFTGPAPRRDDLTAVVIKVGPAVAASP